MLNTGTTLVMTAKHNIDTVATGAQVDATPAKRPRRIALDGRVVSVVPLDAVAHAETLYEGSRGEQNEGLWRYLFEGPFASRAAFDAHLRERARSEDPLFFAIIEKSAGDAVGSAVGYAAYMRREALRLGFTFEGIFRQHMIVKGRNRDTAWFSMLDSEWAQRKAAFERWLD